MTQRQYSLENVNVHLGMPVHGLVDPRTMISVVGTAVALAQRQVPHELKCNVGGSLVDHARDLIADNFLRSSSTHLFWLDSDVTWQPDDFITTLAMATQMEIVCAPYPIKEDPLRYFIAIPERKRNEHECYEINGAGLGFCCVQRKVIEQLAKIAPKYRCMAREWPIARIFKNRIVKDEFMGEDHGFFRDVKALGHKVYMRADLEIGHVGNKEFKGKINLEPSQ